jgi:hypothetical protein
LDKIVSSANKLSEEIDTTSKTFKYDIESSNWNKAFKENLNEIETKKEELDEKGIKDIDNFEVLLEEKESRKQKISELGKVENEIKDLINKKSSVYKSIVGKAKEIALKRKSFLQEILKGQNVSISVKPFRDKEHYVTEFRKIIQREHEFDGSINHLIDKCFKGKSPEKLKEIHFDLDKLRKDETVVGYDGHFKRFMRELDDGQYDKLKILLPEDEIFAQYKPSGSDTFRNISNASAGQKTCSILTFILSYGTTPLILDQPEDDLDNHLVYGLIVDRLRKSKENRQLLVVTHNANIPVNGDSEYILAMDSESKYLQIAYEGTIEEKPIKKEICDVMEGGEDAFKLRSQRYEIIKK